MIISCLRCAEKAFAKGYKVIGIQFYGETYGFSSLCYSQRIPISHSHWFYDTNFVILDLGLCKGILVICFLLSKFEQRSLNLAASSCGRGSFRKCSSCGRGYFYTDKKDAFSRISGYEWTRLYR